MTVESNYVIAIATLSDWLKRLAPVFQPMRSKTKTNRKTYAWLFPRFENCDWFTALFVRVVIGRSNCFGFGFFDSHLKTALWCKKFTKLTFLASALRQSDCWKFNSRNVSSSLQSSYVEIWPSSIPLKPNFPAVNSRYQPVSSQFADFASAPPV